jgi:anti-sigma B factor antagonist
MNSPVVKEFAEQRIAAGETLLVIDLGGCSGMDSTFMGTLAGVAARLTTLDGAALHIAEADARNRRSLEDLGLDFLMEIDPPAAIWRGRIPDIRAALGPPDAAGSKGGPAQRSRHVLEAHQKLSEISEKNASEFAGVVSLLEQQLSGEGPAPKTGPRE